MRTLILTGVLALTAGCATTQAAKTGDDDFSLNTGSQAISAKVSGTSDDGRLLGPQVNLRWSSTAVRGTAFGSALTVDLTDSTARGLLGGMPVQLKAERSGEGLHATGLFGGHLSRLELTDARLTGTVGHCSYDLKSAGGVYQGFRACRGSHGQEPVRVHVPEAVQQLSPSRAALALGILLGSA